MNTINNHDGLRKAATISCIYLLWGSRKCCEENEFYLLNRINLLDLKNLKVR